MPKHRGYVLLIVLIALSTISMLISHAFHLLREKIELQHQAERTLQLRVDATSALHELSSHVYDGKSCLNPRSEQEAIRQPSSWWLAHACLFSFHDLRVYYFISFREQDDCVHVLQFQRAWYQRFLVRVMKDQLHSVQAVLTTIAAVPAVNECYDQVRRRQAGIQLLHFFNLI